MMAIPGSAPRASHTQEICLASTPITFDWVLVHRLQRFQKHVYLLGTGLVLRGMGMHYYRLRANLG